MLSLHAMYGNDRGLALDGTSSALGQAQHTDMPEFTVSTLPFDSPRRGPNGGLAPGSIRRVALLFFVLHFLLKYVTLARAKASLHFPFPDFPVYNLSFDLTTLI